MTRQEVEELVEYMKGGLKVLDDSIRTDRAQSLAQCRRMFYHGSRHKDVIQALREYRALLP